MAEIKRFSKMINISNVETKFNDMLDTTTIATTGTQDDGLVDIPQGSGQSERIGNEIYAKSIFGRMYIVKNTLAPQTAVRVIFYQDKQTRLATIPNVNEVLQSAQYLSCYNYNTRGRFNILSDEQYVVNTNNPNLLIKVNIPLDFKIGYSNGTSTNWNQNAVFLLMIQDTSTNLPTVQYDLRLKYNDK